jgi:hypothetical protein
MRFSISVVCTTLGIALLSGCASSLSGQSGSIPNAQSQARLSPGVRAPISLVAPWMLASGVQRLHLGTGGVEPNAKAAGGIYGSEFYGNPSQSEGMINGYPNPDSKNGKPTCTIAGYAINGWDVDLQGNLVLPAADSASAEPTVNIYKGPGLCGKLVGQIADSTGQASDAKSFNALKDPIYVGEILNASTSEGDVVICTLKSHDCGSPITNSKVTGYGGGVAINTKGDCWLSAGTSTTTGFVLVYWKGCKGAGAVATGTKNAALGGLFFDTKGNLVSIDSTGSLFVYGGCNPKCKLISSSALKGASIFGNLNAKGDQVVVGDITNSDIDVYSYAPSGIKYLYSFNKSLNGTGFTEAGGFDPTNKAL